MEISYKWLQTLIDIPEPPEVVGKALTGTGLEVEAIDEVEAVPGGLAGVVIGEVLTCQPHPDADKLSLTTVDAGQDQPLSIVCGAPNVAAGQRVVVATVGATLHPTNGEPFTIKKAKIRGAASEGMLCAEDEIGLGTGHNGIMVLQTDLPNGTPAGRYFNLESDYRISIGLTPNRIDAASHVGTARDLGAVWQRPIRWPSVDAFRVQNPNLPMHVHVADPAACPRYSGLTMSGLTVGESPEWLRQRLLAIGLTPINNVVDATNFVLHELGQPLHAFDADAITGGQVIVRTVAEGTPFTTLDGVERRLTATDLMICDAEKPLCIAGIFGGKTSGVTAATTRIFLESAYFSPQSIRKTAQQHGLKTDASFRFERGTDPNMPVFALKRAALLITELAGGYVSSDITDLYPAPIEPVRVSVSYAHIDRLIGIRIAPDTIHRILQSLDIQLTDLTEQGFTAVVPPYRVDVTREADVIEEILRIYGLDNVPLSTHLSAESLSSFSQPDPDQWQAKVAAQLTANGFYEIMTLSLTRPAYHDAIRSSLPGADVRLLNPLSEDLSVMRQTLLFSMLETLAYNLNRRQRDLSLFEFGKIYHKTPTTDANAPTYKEQPRLALGMLGQQPAESWQQKSQPLAFAQLAANVQRVLSLFRIDAAAADTEPADPALFQYGLTYRVNQKALVQAGLVQPKLARMAGLKQPVWYADVDWAALLKFVTKPIRYQEVARFPDVRRDLSLVLDKHVSYAQIDRLARQTERKLLRSLNVFDVFEGDSLGSDKKAYSVSFTLQDANQTLTDAAIDKTMQRLMAAFERELGALIRK